MLQCLLENRLFVRAEKCEFHSKSVMFLGSVVSTNGICMDPAKVQAITDWPVPDSRVAIGLRRLFIHLSCGPPTETLNIFVQQKD